jgi:hypothetical protein
MCISPVRSFLRILRILVRIEGTRDYRSTDRCGRHVGM